MKYNHMNPQDALQAHKDLQSKQSMGIHFGTFSLGDDAFDDPTNELSFAAIKENKISPSDFYAPEFGEIKSLLSQN